MEATLDNIKPLVLSQQEEASYLQVTFQCPATGVQVQAQGQYRGDTLLNQTGRQARANVFSSIRNAVTSRVMTTAGTGVVGQIGGNAVNQLVQQGGRGRDFHRHIGKKDKEAGLKAAFASVAGRFTWDANGRRWVATTAAEVETSPFTEHLAAHPLADGYEKDLMIRFLAAIVAADGTVEDAERETFTEICPGADLDALVAGRGLSAVDFEETRAGKTRETLLLLGWAMALSDENLDSGELELLGDAAKALAVDTGRADELKVLAQRHVIEEAIAGMAADGLGSMAIRDKAEELGEAIGLGSDEAARAVIRWSKRQ